jgi:hypothetical protein
VIHKTIALVFKNHRLQDLVFATCLIISNNLAGSIIYMFL